MDSPEHGKEGTGEHGGGRWCAVHNQWHGVLYPCEHYDTETLTAIERGSNQLRSSLRDPTWVQEQIDKGIPPEVMGIVRLFMGAD